MALVLPTHVPIKSESETTAILQYVVGILMLFNATQLKVKATLSLHFSV